MASTIHQIISTLFILICTCFPCINSTSYNYPAVFNFGDSNSDTGGLVSGLGNIIRSPNGDTYFKKPSGRYSDGRLIIDFLMEGFGLPYLNPYMDAIGAPNFRHGCNFAVSGATIFPPQNFSIGIPFPFGIQVAQFIRFKNRVLELQSEDPSQPNKLLPDADVFQNGLYTFDIGQNDLWGVFGNNRTYDQAIAYVSTMVAEFEKGITTLYNEGARNFWIHNTGPLGCLPVAFGHVPDPSTLDEFGCSRKANQAATILNQQLYELCKKFQQQHQDSKVTFVDIFSIKYNLAANYSQHGFEHVTMACCGYGGPPFNVDTKRIMCGQTKDINGTTVTATAIGDSSKFTNWDGIHYTEAANHFVASEILTEKYFSPL